MTMSAIWIDTNSEREFIEECKNGDGMKKKKVTVAEKREIKKLVSKALGLWRTRVKENADKKCEVLECKKHKSLHCHHTESFSTNKALRFDPRNGIAFCATHHKFGRKSAHRSFIFMYLFMIEKRFKDLQYLIDNCNKKVELTVDYMKEIIFRLG